MASSHKYAKVISNNDVIKHDKAQGSNSFFYNWIESQTAIPALILYAYLYWYFLIQFTFGIKYMTTSAWLAGIIPLNMFSTSNIILKKQITTKTNSKRLF